MFSNQLILIRFTQKELVLHQEMYDEAFAKIGLRIGPSLI